MFRNFLRSMVMLLFIGGLAGFFLINPGHWLPSRAAEPLVVRVTATPDLQAWLEDARRRFLAQRPRIAGRLLSLSIAYEEDATIGSEIADRLRASAPPSSASSGDDAWLTSRTAIQLLETMPHERLSDETVIPLASTMLAVTMWEARARDVLPSAGAVLPRSQPLSWNDVDISWTTWHQLSVKPSPGDLSARAALRWAIPHPLRSAAGLSGVVLMSLGDAGPQSVRWPDKPAERKLLPWLGDFLRPIQLFRPSARDTADDFIKYGPSRADVALLPEHLALEVLAYTVERGGQQSVVLYPRVNIAYEYVFIEVSGASRHAPQREALKAFRRYLRSYEGQQLGLSHGLRPILPDLSPRPMDPWQRFSAQGAQFTPQVIWTDVRAVIEPARRLARHLMEHIKPR